MEDMRFQKNMTDWREVLKKNQRKTYIVLTAFVLVYVIVGLIIDLYFRANMFPKATLGQVFYALATFVITPYFTIIFCAVAVISILVALAFHNNLMLIGTEYKKITPDSTDSLMEKQIYNVIEEMKIAAGMDYMPSVYIIEANYMNAFASGFNQKNAMIAITRGLAEKLNRDELQAVLAHELSHIRHGDIKLTIIVSLLSNIMLMAIDVLFWSVLFSGGNRDNDDNGRGNQLAIIIMILRFVLPILSMVLILFLSRTREYMADSGAVELMRSNDPMATALMKISGDHQTNANRYQASYQSHQGEYFRQQAYIFDPKQAGISASKSMSEMFSTHPSIENRLEALGYEQRSA
ncbi:MAG: zinc metalloprotease HtpX [bacterium]|nr:zinc metalloprotease HtpX [bacterium]